ncbi:hypothetical protein V5O48_004766 [Marasmius crinis-equi]|uniref:Phosphatidylserine decarboxylase n=1 Tax=Marasmius crinis-equi TaxID=585013 RepID=A0ABR3FPX7_9AGAR
MALCPIPGLSLPASFKNILQLKSFKNDGAMSPGTFIFDPSTTPVTTLTEHDIHSSNKPVETAIAPESLPDAEPDHLVKALEKLVENTSKIPEDVGEGIHMHGAMMFKIPGIDKLVPGLEKLAASYHIGNFVVMRDTGMLHFESMPIYARIGMHLIFYGSVQREILQKKTVSTFLKDQSIKQGRIYDSPESVKSIPSFVKTYSIKLDELLEPDITKYGCFNEFFYRKLKPDARPVQNAEDALSICSSADCRLVVFPSPGPAKQFWYVPNPSFPRQREHPSPLNRIKGSDFTIPNLLNVRSDSEKARQFAGGSVAIFRLAPQDYHRFHCPIDGVVGEIDNTEGQYYTVNPQAINQNLDVFTENVRSVLYLTHTSTGKQVAIVAIGALLVGSIRWTKGGEKGATVKRGEELGYFAYGGSTIIVVFPEGCVEFDQDLLENSQKSLETLVKVGQSIGKTPKSS